MARSLTRAMLLTLALTLLPVAPAAAMSQKRANKLALAILKPQKTKGPVVVFALSKQLKAGDVISEPVAGVATAKGKKLRKRGRLYWMDLQYGFMFSHPSELLILDSKTGKPLVKRKLKFWPMVNNRAVPFAWGDAHLSLKAAIFKRLTPPQAFSRSGPASLPLRPPAIAAETPAPNPRYANDCLVALGGQSAPSSFQAMKDYWAKLGVQSYGPAPRDKLKKHNSEVEYQGSIDHLPDNCKDIILYLSGHGSGANVLMEETGYGGREDELWLNEAIVSDMVKTHPQFTFKLIVDACASGTFIDDVIRLAKGAPNLLIAVSATTGDQSAFAYPSTDGWRQPLTETLIQGMEASEDPVDKDQSGVPAGARLIELGMANRPKSRAETWFGKKPESHSNLPPYSTTPPPTETFVCHSAGETCPKDNSTCDGGATCSGNTSTCTGSGTTCGPGSGDKCSGGAKCTGPGASCDGAGTECTQTDGACTNGATCPAPPPPTMKCTGVRSAFNPNTGWSFDVQCDQPWMYIRFSAQSGNAATNSCCEQAGWNPGQLSAESVIWKRTSAAAPVNTNQSFGVDWTMDITAPTAVASASADGSNPVTVTFP